MSGPAAIYLDHNATTPLDPAVREEMQACLGTPGNASSAHAFGQAARRIIDRARAQVARLIGAAPEEIVFTASGTEADNLAVFGATAGRVRPHVLLSPIEHQAVLNPGREVARRGGALGLLWVDSEGRIDPAQALGLLRPETALVSVMLANNDVGTLQPVAALAPGLAARGVLLHTDAVQAAGKVPIDVRTLGVDLLSLSAHKLHGPQGIGALFVRQGVRLSPLLFGGHQERGFRPGTENVAAIAGFGKAAALALERLQADAARVLALREAFEAAILSRIPGAQVNGAGAARLPNTASISFEGMDGELLAINLDLLGLAASTGSACSAGDHEPSHVLLAMGRSSAEARAAVRFSFGRDNTPADAGRAAELVARAVGAMRGGSP